MGDRGEKTRIDRGKTAAAAATDSGSGSSNNRGGGRPKRWEEDEERGEKMRMDTGEVERREGERCAPATVCAGKGGEEVHANDG